MASLNPQTEPSVISQSTSTDSNAKLQQQQQPQNQKKKTKKKKGRSMKGFSPRISCFRAETVETPDGRQSLEMEAEIAGERRNPTHLVVFIHGIIGSPSDWRFAAKQFVKRFPEDVLVHCSKCNSSTLTFDGVDVMGERLAQEVISVIKHHPELQKISFVGHSLGGLIARYTIGRLYGQNITRETFEENGECRSVEPGAQCLEEKSQGKIAGLEPMNFITFATPHLGSIGHKQIPILCGFYALEKMASRTSWIVGRTGKHLFLKDHDEGKPPLLLQMINDCGDLKFMSALQCFRRRVVYSNARFDHIVGWKTSSIRRQHELPKRQHLHKNEKYPHIVNVETNKTAIQQEALLEGKFDSIDVEEAMIRGLNRVSWERVDVSFRKSRQRYFAHNTIQMCLLLAICIWLLYQVKHSHDKKEVFDENNLEFANKIDDDRGILIFGRKDLNYGVEMASKNGKHGEEEESEEEEIDGSHEILKLGRKDLNLGVGMASKDEKHGKEEESEEREEGNGEENVDKERAAGDDEIDEHDLEEVDEEADRGEYLTDVEKEDIEKELEKEENEEKGSEDVDSSENHDHDGDDRNSQEALEEHYRDDDASSAVVQDNHMIRSEIENEESRNSKEVHLDNIEKFNLENEHETNRTENSPVDKNDSNPNASKLPIFMGDGEKAIEKPSVNATNDEKGVEVSQSKLENEPLSNMTTTESSNQTALHNNATVDSTETPSLYLNSRTTILNSTKDQNATFKVGAFDKAEPNAETLGLKQTEKSKATTIAEDIETTVLEQTEASNATSVVKEASNVVLEQTSAVEESQEVKSEQTEKSNRTNVVEESDDNSVSSLATSENSDAIHTENTDSLSSMVTHEERDSLIDLGTLPQIASEGRNTEDAAAE